MATIVTVRPTGPVYFGSIGGAAPTAADLSDNNDNTRVQFFQEYLGETSYVYCEVGNYALQATQKVAGVRGRARIRMPVSSSASPLLLRIDNGGSTWHGASTSNVAGNGWQELATSYRTTDFNGLEWGQASIDMLWIEATAMSSMSGSAAWEVSEFYVDFDVRNQPTISITSPTAGQRVVSTTPTIHWTYNAQGDTVNKYHLKIFTAATVGSGGFDPTTSPTVFDGTSTPGAATSRQVTTALTPGSSYYAYVRIATDFKGTDWWSNWSSVQFTISRLPVVSGLGTNPVTPITSTNRPNITGTYTDPDGEAAEYLHIKVFPEAVYGAPGFNVDTSTAAWDSVVPVSTTSGQTFSVQVGVALSANVNYIAWVRASEAGAGQRWGDWASTAAFVIQTAPGAMFDPPATPTISAAADNTNQRVVIQLETLDNMLTRNQSTIDTGITGWEVDTNVTAVNLTRDTTTFLQGGGALRFVATAAGSTKVRTINTNQLPVAANRTYTALASLRSGQAGTPSAQVLINWYTSGGAYITTTVGAAVTLSNTGWTQAIASAVAPATAGYAQVILEVTNAAAGNVFLADNLSFAPGTSTTWYRGGLALELGTLSDGFNRANSTTSLGTADSGQAWTAHTGTWGIDSNRAYITNTGDMDAVATIQSAFLADGYVEADITLSSTVNRADAGLVFRAADGNNYLLANLRKAGTGVDDRISIWKRAAGTYTLLANVDTAGLINGTTYKLRVEFYGGQILLYVNGELRLSHLLLAGDHTSYGSNARYGMRINRGATASDNGGTRIDNFVAKLPKTQLVTVERSLDDGTSWSAVRGALNVPVNNQLATFFDYEVPTSVLAQYRAVTTADEAGTVLTSVYSATATQVGVLTVDRWYLKDPLEPDLNTTIDVATPFRFVRKEPQAVFDPLGRKTSVVVTDGPKGITGSLTIYTKDKAAYDRVQAIINTGHVLLLQDPLGRSWFIKFGDSHDWELIRAQAESGSTAPIRHFHTVTLPFHEVAAPAVV